jgi:hypothetical protein
MTRLIIPIILVGLLFSCGQDRPKINYNQEIDTTSVIEDRVLDTTKVLVSELPIRFDSTDILIFGIELIDIRERERMSKIGSGSYSNSDFSSSYFNGDYLNGHFINLVFQDKTGTEIKLTNKKIAIRSVSFLRQTFRKHKVGYLLYSVSDRDTNGDKNLDNSDLESLYISKLDGTEFKKITKELHEFYDSNQIKGETRFYFRTLEDENKDGELNNRDKFHYYYLDFTSDNYQLAEYNPLKIFE